jgi:hypothetical protein
VTLLRRRVEEEACGGVNFLVAARRHWDALPMRFYSGVVRLVLAVFPNGQMSKSTDHSFAAYDWQWTASRPPKGCAKADS